MCVKRSQTTAIPCKLLQKRLKRRTPKYNIILALIHPHWCLEKIIDPHSKVQYNPRPHPSALMFGKNNWPPPVLCPHHHPKTNENWKISSKTVLNILALLRIFPAQNVEPWNGLYKHDLSCKQILFSFPNLLF